MSNSKVSTVKEPFKWKARYTVLAFIWFAWLFSFLDRMIMNVSLPFIGEAFDLTKTQQGYIISAFFISYAAFQIPGGYLADRFGPRRVMVIAIVWWSIFTALTGMVGAIGSLSALTVMLITRFLFGIGEGSFPASSWKCISTYFPKRERGRATSIQSSVNTLGPFFATLVAATIISWLGWRNVFIIMGIPGLIVAVGLWIYCRDNPKDNPQITEEDLRDLEADIQEQAAADVKSTEKVPMSKILCMPVLWQLAAIWFLFDITFWGYTTWLPSYLMDARGLSLKEVGVWGSIPFLFGAIGTLSGGYVSDKFVNGRNLMYVASSIIAAILLYCVFTSESLMATIIYQCIASLFMFFAMGLFWGVLMHMISSNIMGTASGIVNFGGQLAGVVAAPVMGYLVDASGGNYDNAFWFIIITLVASAFVIMTLKTKKAQS